MSPDYEDTAPATMTPGEIRRHTETMGRFREIEAAARFWFRAMLVLIVVFVAGIWKGWL